MALLLRLNTFGEILEGRCFRGYCHISEAPDGDGFCVVVYEQPDRQSTIMLSDWQPTVEDLNAFARELNWQIQWLDPD